MAKPVILAVAEDAATLAVVEANLRGRYSADYDVACARSAGAGLDWLRGATGEVTILLADLWMPEMTGVDFLEQARDLVPDAKRALLVDWGDRTIAEPILRATTWGHIDNYARKPFSVPDEHFHRFLAELLDAWRTGRGHRFEALHVIDAERSTRSYELRDLLQRSGIPYGYRDARSPDGAALLASAGLPDGPLPVVRFYDGRALADPGITDLADALGVNAALDDTTYDVVVVGAGPAGLAAAVYGASEGLRVLVLDRQTIGGQAGSSSLIRNYLGFPHGLGGSDLAARAYEQAWLFGTKFHFGVPVVGLVANGPGAVVELADGTTVRASTVVLATGVEYRRLGIPSLEAFAGSGLFYGAATTEAPALAGEHVHVIGGGNSAGQAAMHLSRYAASVTILVRGESLAATMSAYLIRDIEASSTVDVRAHSEVVGGAGGTRLESIQIRDRRTGTVETVPSAAVMALIGAHPHTDWLPPAVARDERGFVVTGADGRPLLESSLPGVFAAGDVRHGSEKRVAAAVGEGSTAIRLIHTYLAERRAAS